MKVKFWARWILALFMILTFTVGCSVLSGDSQEPSSEEEIKTSVAGTMIAVQVAETLAGGAPAAGDTVDPAGTIPQAPTVTTSPTVTLTPVPDVPMASVSVNTNCRTGPDKIYDSVGALLVGEQAEVVGKFADGTYWVIKNPDGVGECWLWGYYATVVGPIEGLRTYDQPSTPTPAFDWAGTWSISRGPAEGGFYTIWSMTAAVAGNGFNASIDFGGTIVTFSGTISADYLTVSGTWQEDVDESGPFKFYAVGVNQFQGFYSDEPITFGICGSRGGAGYPEPCYRP
jgi:hypothetical protein